MGKKGKILLNCIFISLFLSSCGGGGGGGSNGNVINNNSYVTSESNKKNKEDKITTDNSFTENENEAQRSREFKIAIIDNSFSRHTERENKMIIIPSENERIDNEHGDTVVKVALGKNNINNKIIAAEIGGIEYRDGQKIQTLFPKASVYEKILKEFGEQKVKIFNQSWGANYPDEDYKKIKQDNYKQYIGNSTLNENDKLIDFYKKTVVDNGGLFIWSAGNTDKIKENRVEKIIEYDNATLLASLPKYLPEVEKGWIATVFPYIKDGIHYAYAGDAKNWSISAYGEVIEKNILYRGSSFSSPLVAKVAGEISNKYPWMTASQIRETLFTTTDDVNEICITDSDETRYAQNKIFKGVEADSKYGWGYLNEVRALRGPGGFISKILNVDPDNKVNGNYYFQARIPVEIESYFDNDIRGDRGIYKSGQGKLHLCGNNTYTGDSIVHEGELHVHKSHSSKNTLIDEQGTLVLYDKGYIGQKYNNNFIENSGNILNRGKFILKGSNGTIAGDYTSENRGVTEIDLGAKLTVLGKVNLGAKDILTIEKNGEYLGKKVKTVAIQGGEIIGQPNVTMSGDMFESHTQIEDNNLIVELNRKDLSNYINSSDESTINTAKNIDKVLSELDKKLVTNNLSPEEKIKGRVLETLSSNQLKILANYMSGEIYASAQSLNFLQAREKNRALSNRMAQINSSDWESWIQGIGSYGKIQKNGYAKAKTHSIGGQFGIDKKINVNATIGIAMGYSYGKADFNRFAGEYNSDSIGISIYGRHNIFGEGEYIAGRVGVDKISTRVKREIINKDLDKVLGDIHHHDKMLSFYGEIGDKMGYFTPYIGYSFDILKRGHFSENNAEWGIVANKKTYESSAVVLGLRGEYAYDSYKLYGYVSHEVNIGNRDLSFTGHFNESTTLQRFKGIGLPKNITWIGLGIDKEIINGVSFVGNIDISYEKKNSVNGIGSIGIKYSF